MMISPIMFSSKSDLFYLYPIHRYLEKPLTNIGLVWSLNNFEILFPLYKHSLEKVFNFFLLFVEYKLKEITNNSKKNDSGKFIQTKSEKFKLKGFHKNMYKASSKEISFQQKNYNELSNEHFNLEKFKQFLEITEKIEKKGIDLTIFEVPTYSEKCFSEKFISVYNISKSLLDYKIIEIDKNKFSFENFRDIDHMNDSGADIFTEEIIYFIKNNFEEYQINF